MMDLVDFLRGGGVAVIATDTVYGLVADATNVAAVTELYGLKQRDHKPGTLIAASIDQLVQLGIPRRYLTAVEQFWPGAVSVVVPCGDDLKHLHQGVGSLAVRIPDDATLSQLLLKTGPLQTTSANQPGQPPANTVAEAKAYFGDQIKLYVDGGDLSDRQPSTVVRIIDDAIEVIRPGAVRVE
jgi:tRNA threonylcarbamoyl adenosine modification protein (Sua5/YciO/YrdC/YwlC family)